MRVISTNIGIRKNVNWKGKIIETGIFKQPVYVPIYLGKTDVEKDQVVDRKYHGGLDKACYAYSSDHYPFWGNKFPEVDMTHGAFGENLTIQNLDENTLRIGDQYQIGEEVIVEISQPRQPCMKLGIRFNDQRIVKHFIHEKFPGVYLRILKEGWVQANDLLRPVFQKSSNLTVTEVHSLLSKNKDVTLAKKAIMMAELAESYKNDIKRVYQL